jgi:hypothetical protein
LVDVIPSHDQGQGQVTSTDPFGQAQKIWPNASLLARKKFTGTATTHRNLICNHVNLVVIAKSSDFSDIQRAVHRHATCTLHQGFDDHGADEVGSRHEQLLEFFNGV